MKPPKLLIWLAIFVAFLAHAASVPLVMIVPPDLPASALSGHLQFVNIVATAVVVTAWTAVFTVAIGCFVVMVMKGPAYVADRYDVSDAERPRRD